MRITVCNKGRNKISKVCFFHNIANGKKKSNVSSVDSKKYPYNLKPNNLNIDKNIDKFASNKGSVLILVLWIMVIISYLSSQYISHNREKVAITLNATELFKRESAAFSVLELIASSQYDLLKTKSLEENADFDLDSNRVKNSKTRSDESLNPISMADINKNATDSWLKLNPGGVVVWVKVENESSKIQLSVGQEQNIRTTIQNFYGGEQTEESEIFTDSILDWLDPDDLVRLNGAESAYYNELFPPYEPSNSPFKSMTEIFLVRGFNSELFWGSPYEYIISLPIYQELRYDYQQNLNKVISNSQKKSKERNRFSNYKKSDIDDYNNDSHKMQTILEQFTIHPKNYKRVSMLFPDDGDKWYNEIFWIKKEGNAYKLVEQISRIMVVRITSSN